MAPMKVAIPQDEMYYTEELCSLFQHIEVDSLYTCAYPIDYQTLYPKEKSGLTHYFTTFPGFVDEDSLQTIEQLRQEKIERDIDIGYRGNNLPYYIGKHGQLKRIVAEKFLEATKNSDCKIDISIDPAKVFFGKDWLRFLCRCRTALGCLGGSGLHDPKGEIRIKVENYLKLHPGASFEEVEENCFKGLDNSIHIFAISPRHFECAMTKTCQVLVEGDYKVFRPNVDYIEIKKDFSNIEEVLHKIKDHAYCASIAENAYKTAILSGKYTYRAFVHEVLSHIRQNVKPIPNHRLGFIIVGMLLKLRSQYEVLLNMWMKVWMTWNIVLTGSSFQKLHYIFSKALPKQIKKLKKAFQ